uniref:Uncharacterized protein n=1 Tax=Medicago truncatula TaxID=3880 RepID=A2Q2J8_MEDTR|nr:hypothetical protein MtrDRAFT_AC150891g49v2 [Medicago truncatula]
MFLFGQVASSSPRTACTYQFAYVIGRVPSSIQEQLVPVNMFPFGQVTSSIQEQLVPVYLFLSGGVTSSHPRTSSHLFICLCFRSSDQFESENNSYLSTFP